MSAPAAPSVLAIRVGSVPCGAATGMRQRLLLPSRFDRKTIDLPSGIHGIVRNLVVAWLPAGKGRDPDVPPVPHGLSGKSVLRPVRGKCAVGVERDVTGTARARTLAVALAIGGLRHLVHPRHIGRMITGHASVFPTPPHQDFPLIQGTAKTWTCWIPVGDVPREMGGLTILKGSHRQGYLPIQPAKGAGGIAVPLCPNEVEWVQGDFEAGDLLAFSAYTIHKALRCQRKDVIRLSLDVRYQAVDDIVEAKSLLPHCNLTWEEIYAGWPDTPPNDLKYYWQKLPLQLTPWEDGYLQPKRRIC